MRRLKLKYKYCRFVEVLVLAVTKYREWRMEYPTSAGKIHDGGVVLWCDEARQYTFWPDMHTQSYSSRGLAEVSEFLKQVNERATP